MKPDGFIGDYGIDSPTVVHGLGLGVAVALLVTVVGGILDEVTVMAAAFGAALFISLLGLILVRSSRVAKLRERVRVINRLELQGGERVLDVGCGRGLLLVEVARRLNDQGRAYGVDRWHAVDGVVVDAELAIRNAHVEGVDHQLDVTSADPRALPYPDNSFDAVVSGLALHHVAGFESRVHAIREIARVLVPGGRVVLIDRHHTRNYVDALRASNVVEVRRSRRVWHLLPPARYVTGTKPEARIPAVPRPEPVAEFELAPEPEPEPEVEVEVEVEDEVEVEVELDPELELAPLPVPLLRIAVEPPPPALPTPAFAGPDQLELSDAVTGERDGAGYEAEDGSSV